MVSKENSHLRIETTLFEKTRCHSFDSLLWTSLLNSIISLHNKSLLKKPKQDIRLCNCRNEINCPLQRKCLTNNILYPATVKCKEDAKFYIGLSKTAFNERYRKHIKDFNNIKYRTNKVYLEAKGGKQRIYSLLEDFKKEQCTLFLLLLHANSVPNNGNLIRFFTKNCLLLSKYEIHRRYYLINLPLIYWHYQ